MPDNYVNCVIGTHALMDFAEQRKPRLACADSRPLFFANTFGQRRVQIESRKCTDKVANAQAGLDFPRSHMAYTFPESDTEKKYC